MGVLLLVLLPAACSQDAPQRAERSAVLPGLEDKTLDSRLRGRLLLGELGCVNCHAQGDAPLRIDARRGPELAGVGARLLADYLPHFLSDPQAAKPGTTMPDLLSDRDEAARDEAAQALAQYLRSFSARENTPASADLQAGERGRKLFHEVGCAACHAPRDAAGRELPLPGSVPLGDLSVKYSAQGLRAFLLSPQDVRPSQRMPDLRLTPSEAHDLTCYLLAGALPLAPAPPAVDEDEVARGRILFGTLGCAHCHDLDDAQRAPSPVAQPLRELDARRGCLSEDSGSWPHFALSNEQRDDLALALRSLEEPLSDEQQILLRLAAANCGGCHARGSFGGVAAQRSRFFLGDDVNLGQDGRLPPPLDGVGAKLQFDWLVDAVAHGQSVRPYLRTRMPGFGKPLGESLATLFARTDSLPPVELLALPADGKQAEAVVQLGCELVGERGMNCIGCHSFAGEKVGTMAAVDLIDSTSRRLRREWLVHYLRDPVKFRPGTLMPQFFVDGVSTRPALGEGNAARQIDAIWHYLAQGRNVRKPSGMRHPPMPLRVADEAVILRRSVQNTGKRGISVGYPGGVNLSFDAESLALNQIWWGPFVDAAGVWTGQGSGEARILGERLAALPKGPVFAVLSSADAPWPAASRRELGQRFLGYDLDEKQRPTFRYTFEDVAITDALVELPRAAGETGGRMPRLRRRLSFAGASDKTLQFLAAREASIEDLGEGRVRIGAILEMHLPPATFLVRDAGAQRELLAEIAIRGGRAELLIEYSLSEPAR